MRFFIRAESLSELLQRTSTFLMVLLGLAILAPANAQPQPSESPSPPERVLDLLEKVQLGVRVDAGFQHNQFPTLPLEDRGLQYLGRPVGSSVSATTPTYGVGAGLRIDKRLEIFGTFRMNEAMQPTSYLEFQDGESAIPSEYDFRRWSLRAHYFVLDHIGFGVMYKRDRTSLARISSRDVEGDRFSDNIFTAQSSRRSFALYVPARFDVTSQLALFGWVGASVYGSSDNRFNTRFTFYQDPDQPAEITPDAAEGSGLITLDGGGLNRQFLRIGLERPFLGMTWRLAATGSRVQMKGAGTAWHGGVDVQVGLPF